MSSPTERDPGASAEDLIVDRDDAVAVVTLNRPRRRNALTASLMVALDAAMTELDRDESVGAIVLTGADPAFCAGLDLGQLAGDAQNLTIDETGRPWPRLRTPVIGAVNGPAVTGGLELVLHCDFAVGSERAAFADTHARVGVMPGWGLSMLLPRTVGLRRAKHMSFTGNYVRAEDAVRWGLIDAVVPHEQLLETAVGLAKDACSIPREALATLLTLYDDNSEEQMAPGLRREHLLARDWRDRAFSAARVAEGRESLRSRGKAQLS